VIDGFVIGLSPWGRCGNVRFDESLWSACTDTDFDMLPAGSGEAGRKKVVTTHLRVIHHHSLELIRRPSKGGIAAHMRVAEKWDGRLASQPRRSRADWKERADGRRPAPTRR